MVMKKYELTLLEEADLTMEELGRRVGLQHEEVQTYFLYGLIDPQADTPEPLFNEEAVVRIHKIERLRADLGINLAGCGLVLDLLERIEELENQIRGMGS